MPDDPVTRSTCPAGWRALAMWLPVPLLVLSLFAASFWLRLVSGAGRDGTALVLVFPPLWSRAEALAAAGALAVPIVDYGRLPFVVAVQPEGPGIGRLARSAGALAVLRSPAPTLCAVP